MEGTIKRTDKDLLIELENYQKDGYRKIYDYLANELLFWNDMYFETYGNEWLYIEDANYNAVYMVNDYDFDCIQELAKTGTTAIPISSMSYKEYQTEMEQFK